MRAGCAISDDTQHYPAVDIRVGTSRGWRVGRTNIRPRAVLAHAGLEDALGGPSASLLSSPSFPSQIQCPGPLAVISHVHFFIFEG